LRRQVSDFAGPPGATAISYFDYPVMCMPGESVLMKGVTSSTRGITSRLW
jgi:hypothetical protein